MTDKQKKVLYRIIATALLYAVLLVMEHIVKPAFMEQWYVTLVLFLIPYFVIGWDIMYKAVRNISHGQVFDENFLMLIATIGAFVVGEYSEGFRNTRLRHRFTFHNCFISLRTSYYVIRLNSQNFL